MKRIKAFQYHKSFYAIELEDKEFAILTDRAFLPTDGATFNNTVLEKFEAYPTESGLSWFLCVLFICGQRKIDVGIFQGHESEINEFCLRANKLIQSAHRTLPS